MKRNILTIVAVLTLLAIGGTREEVTPASGPTAVVRYVNYIVCGEVATVIGEAGCTRCTTASSTQNL